VSYSETRRQIVHVTMVAWAFLLRFITWPQAAALALTALLFNAFVLPRIGGHAIFRPDDVRRGVPAGILFYPLAVLLLILVFRSRLDIVAAAWAILALGDGAATLVGRSIGRTPIPWNRDKTWEGTTAFVLCASVGAVFLCWWTQPNIQTPQSPWFVFGAPVAASIAAALVETIPVRLDDNLSVPFAAGVTLWIASLADAATMQVMAPAVAGRLLPAFLWNAGFATVALLEGAVSRSGAIVGVLIGLAVYLGSGWEGWLLLVATFAAAVVTSKVGLQRKTALGIAQEREGRRGAGNAIANCLVSAIAAIVAITSPYQSAAWLVLVTGLTAGAADTVASEIGKAWGTRTFLVVGFRPVPAGTSGAISVQGTIANVAAAAALASLGAALGLISMTSVPLVVAAALVGAFVESALGATLEKPGILNNDVLNFINTAVAAGVALMFSL
jgi:uncharacterized protein (TIGR00297 family)